MHTAAFALIAGCIVVFTWDAIRGRAGHRSLVTAGIAITETVIYGATTRSVPLTPLAEELGAESGTVTDLYLPRAVSARIPLLGGSALLLGLAFHDLPDGGSADRPDRSGRDDDHLAGGQLRDLRRDAAENETTKIRPGSRSEHDHVGLLGA